MSSCEEKGAPCYCVAMRKAARAVTRLYDDALEPSGLRVTQFSLLRNLQRMGPVSFAALSEAMQLDRTTLVRNLNLLARQGLLEMRAVPSSRAHEIRLTDKGGQVIERTGPSWEEAQKYMETVLTAEERGFLRSVLAKLQRV